MAALLSKFRIDCTNVIVIPETGKAANEKTVQDFNNIVRKYVSDGDCSNTNPLLSITKADLAEHKERVRLFKNSFTTHHHRTKKKLNY